MEHYSNIFRFFFEKKENNSPKAIEINRKKKESVTKVIKNVIYE